MNERSTNRKKPKDFGVKRLCLVKYPFFSKKSLSACVNLKLGSQNEFAGLNRLLDDAIPHNGGA
jgi:hypothetical protein